jgi:nucleotidyltransferase/DNA polymerase involved in DNA repair
MPSITAKRKYPDLIFVKPRFDAYKAISLQIRDLYRIHAHFSIGRWKATGPISGWTRLM